jgi:hypothetical protein
MPVSKSQLMNVMSALETDFVFNDAVNEEKYHASGTETAGGSAAGPGRATGTDIETSTPRAMAVRTGEWVAVPTTKRQGQIDQVFRQGLDSGVFKPLKLKNSDLLPEDGTVEVGNVLSNKCDLRKLPRVRVLRAAALRHFLGCQLLEEYQRIIRKIEETPRLQKYNLPIITSDFLFIIGNSDSSAGGQLDLYQEVSDVVESIEPMGILQLKEFSRRGTVGITKESLRMWLDTVIAVKQMEAEEAAATEGGVTSLRLSESAAVAIKQV